MVGRFADLPRLGARVAERGLRDLLRGAVVRGKSGRRRVRVERAPGSRRRISTRTPIIIAGRSYATAIARRSNCSIAISTRRAAWCCTCCGASPATSCFSNRSTSTARGIAATTSSRRTCSARSRTRPAAISISSSTSGSTRKGIRKSKCRVRSTTRQKLLSVTVKQTHKTGDTIAAAFTFPVTIALMDADGHEVAASRRNKCSASKVSLSRSTRRPRRCAFDPEHDVLKTLKHKRGREALETALQHAPEAIGRADGGARARHRGQSAGDGGAARRDAQRQVLGRAGRRGDGARHDSHDRRAATR